MFAIFRMGTHIPVPGVDPSAIEALFNNGSLFGLLDMFSGGALSKFSVFAMSITPYINASIIIQLLNVVVPTLEQWSKEGQEGYKKTTKVTRYFTVLLAFLQALGMSIGLKQAILNPGPVSILIIAITLTAGTVFLMWVGEQITANGVGNGISLIIFAGICIKFDIEVIIPFIWYGTFRVVSCYTLRCICESRLNSCLTDFRLSFDRRDDLVYAFIPELNSRSFNDPCENLLIRQEFFDRHIEPWITGNRTYGSYDIRIHLYALSLLRYQLWHIYRINKELDNKNLISNSL